MPQALDASSYIHQGLWINWTKSKVLGTTLTLSPKDAAILSPALAILISIAGSQLWTLFRLALHQSRATSDAKDGLYHQQQIVLRNTSTDLNTLWRLSRIAFAWRHQIRVQSFRKSIILIIWTLVHLSCVVLIGLFSSSLLETGDQVLSRSPYCGTLNDTYYEDLSTSNTPTEALVQYQAHWHSRYQQTKQYFGFCNTSSPSETCRTLPQDFLPWNSSLVGGLCPFQSSVCSPQAHEAIVFDTGYISSHSDLGLNAPKSERLAYRRVNTCTPLNDERFISDWTDAQRESSSTAQPVVNAYYGPNAGNASANTNATFSYANYSSSMAFDQLLATDPYQLYTVFAGAGAETLADFSPIPELQREDADVYLTFLTFNNAYEAPVTDPWFSAQKSEPFPSNDGAALGVNVYGRERPITTLGCTEQHQICVDFVDGEHAEKCTPLTGKYMLAAEETLEPLHLSPSQLATYIRVLLGASDASVYDIIRGLAATDPPLLARSLIMDLVGLGLPDNQWQLETAYWQALSMAELQRSVIEYSTGQFAADVAFINTTQSQESQQLCQNQVIRDSSHRSFNFFALVFVIVLAVLIIIAGLTVEDCIGSWRRRTLRYTGSKQDMWLLNGDLEMFRLLSEHNGAVWSRSSNGIPLSEPGHTLGISQLRVASRSNTSLASKEYGQSYPNKDRSSPDDSDSQAQSLIHPFATRSLRPTYHSRQPTSNSSDSRVDTYENPFSSHLQPEQSLGPNEDESFYPPSGWGVLPSLLSGKDQRIA